MRSPGIKRIRWVYKPVIHILLITPIGLLIAGFFQDTLGANPVEAMTNQTGEWGLRILLISLMVTPLARLTSSGWLIHLRRLIGLYSFFYILTHFLIYLLFDLSLDFGFLVEDVIDRPYITVGFSAFVILLLLALTSPLAVRKKMQHWWVRLHKFVYAAGALGVLHFLWVTKADDTEPFVYGGIFAVLMLYRLLRNRFGIGVSARA